MNTQYLQVWKRVAALGILAVGMATPALAQKTVSRSFAMPAQVNAMMSMTGCQNAPGPQITMEGEISLGGLTVEMLFRNNVKGTHNYTVQNAVEVEAVAADSTMGIPKQPVLGGIGGNPFIWIHIMDGNNHPLSGEIFLGRCVQGPFVASADFEGLKELRTPATFSFLRYGQYVGTIRKDGTQLVVDPDGSGPAPTRTWARGTGVAPGPVWAPPTTTMWRCSGPDHHDVALPWFG